MEQMREISQQEMEFKLEDMKQAHQERLMARLTTRSQTAAEPPPPSYVSNWQQQ